MKKLLLIPALLAGTLAFSEQKNYEISPMVGYDYHESSLGFKDDGYLLGGLEFQINDVESIIKPEFSVFFSQEVDYTTGASTDVLRGAINGVYALDALDSFTPFVKAGLGIENISNETPQSKSGLFVDVGVGAKVNFTENLALKLEAIYLGKVAQQNEGILDHNLIALVGFTYSFGEKAQKAVAPQAVKAPVTPKPAPKPVQKPAPVVAPVVVDGDDDKDGVLNSKDSCLSTLQGAKVDAKGCNIDNDNDGVLNAQDICPKTLAGEEVNSDGCPKTVPLNINFENNSDKIKSSSDSQIQAYANFLTKYANYNAKIIGYTDSRGRDSYNQALSEKRANAVVEALIAQGVSSKQLTSLGKGEANPIADNKTAEGRAQNRRIEAQLTRN
ncbi:OmpA family protein [Sulfurimonas sp. SAG-AH-194-C20]|nr:OmpA family protein [Sulfurimonas sp. SAG-AH-194-C20]MDF1878056.1 OmpA family protein [Sulfurimonas sp. SAG-AH-194-C20]